MSIVEERLKAIQYVDNIEIKIGVENRLSEGQIEGTIITIVCPFFEWI